MIVCWSIAYVSRLYISTFLYTYGGQGFYELLDAEH